MYCNVETRGKSNQILIVSFVISLANNAFYASPELFFLSNFSVVEMPSSSGITI